MYNLHQTFYFYAINLCNPIVDPGSVEYSHPSSVTFYTGNSTGSRGHVQLSIHEDQQVEGAESFRISIVSTEYVTTPRGGGVTTVTVEDNDGRY